LKKKSSPPLQSAPNAVIDPILANLQNQVQKLEQQVAQVKAAPSPQAAPAPQTVAQISVAADPLLLGPRVTSAPSARADIKSLKPSLPGGADVDKMNAVKNAMRHSWMGYKKFAWGQDELRPMSKSGNNWLHQGGTIVDALDTLWIMGMKEEFDEGVAWVKTSLSFGGTVSFFETTIRVLGGLLSAYEFSGDKVLLEKARDIGDRLLKAFNTPSGLPWAMIDLMSGSGSAAQWTGGQLILAEIGTVQMEFTTLSRHTGDPKYEQICMKVYEHVRNNPVQPPGLYPLYADPNSGRWTSSQVALGAMGDSFFEYLVKVWLLRGRKDGWLKKIYDESSSSIIKHMVKKSEAGLTYVGEFNNGQTNNKMDHLACFVGGMFALGAPYQADAQTLQQHLDVTTGIAETCYNLYTSTACGLSAEFVNFNGRSISPGASYNILRPEAIEAIFYAWRATHDPKFRRMGWEMFLSFEKWCKVESGGYAGLKDVNRNPPEKDDTMQTFWLAETLKYFYLLFTDDDVVPLTDYVFNTEAHPFRVHDLPLIWESK
jgi:mannosyl-oligosaccharide alpha-1,2-mannosidase